MNVTAATPRRRGADSLTVGYLHLGKSGSGVLRYGRMVASTAAARKDVFVIEADPGDRAASISDLRRAARKLDEADVIHIQWKLAEWGGARAALPRLEVFLAARRRPIVVTLHDVYPRRGLRERWLEPGAIGLRRLSLAARWLVVHSREERGRLAGMVPDRKVGVVPHFVEERAPLPDRAAAKRGLGLDGRRVITLLGYMTRRKGHRLVLEALGQLPDDVLAIFAGSPIEGREARGGELEAYARELGVSDRVRFTGFVPDAELERILTATDVSISPFRDMSASGSVSTWISTARPMVASDLPAFREYDELVRGSMRIFAPRTAEALAARVAGVLDEPRGPIDPAVDRLRQLLATPRVVERYMDVYRAAANSSS